MGSSDDEVDPDEPQEYYHSDSDISYQSDVSLQDEELIDYEGNFRRAFTVQPPRDPGHPPPEIPFTRRPAGVKDHVPPFPSVMAAIQLFIDRTIVDYICKCTNDKADAFFCE